MLPGESDLFILDGEAKALSEMRILLYKNSYLHEEQWLLEAW